MNNPFKITDLPNNTWSVTWPGFEYNVVNNPDKADKLLGILFNEVEVEEAMVGVVKAGESNFNECETMHLSWIAWHAHPAAHARHLARFTIPGVRFLTLAQAEKFKDIMEKRLAWRRLSNKAWE